MPEACKPSRFRLKVFRTVYPWRESRNEALDDAVSTGNGSRDEHLPTRVYLGVGAVIESAP
jgi:hypothetical protein